MDMIFPYYSSAGTSRVLPRLIAGKRHIWRYGNMYLDVNMICLVLIQWDAPPPSEPLNSCILLW